MRILLTANAFYPYHQGALSGGDKRFIEIFKRLARRDSYWIELMTVRACHEAVRRAGFEVRGAHFVPSFRAASAIGIALDYLIRMGLAIVMLGRVYKRFDLVYNTTDVLTDVLPAFVWHTLSNPRFVWAATAFHIITHPSQRPGSRLGNWLSYIQQRLCHWMLRRADLVIVDNLQVAQVIAARGIKMTHIAVAPAGGVDVERMGATAPSTETFDALFVGRLHASKGVFDFPEIWSAVCRALPERKLALIGSGPDDQVTLLKARLREDALDSNVVLLGSDRDVFAYLKSARVFVFPSHEEGWGIAVCEALASGLPVVGYDLPVYAEVFDGAVQTVDIGDTAGIARRVVEILTSPARWQQLSERARAVGRRYTWETLAETENRLLQQAQANTRPC